MFFSKGNEIVKLISMHSDAVFACFTYYLEAMDGILQDCSHEGREKFTEGMRKLEYEADDMRHQIIRMLLQGGLLPDSRKSIMKMIEEMDAVANISQDVIQDIYLQQMCIHELIKEPIHKMNQLIKGQFELLLQTVKSVVDKYDLDEMFEIIREIEKIEAQVDDIEHGTIKAIFETDLELAQKLQIRELLTKIGDLADIIEDISDLIEIIMMSRRV